jgi:hypothetical protein
MPSDIGYHANEASICRNFLAPASTFMHFPIDPGKRRLGQGMYFWDNESNARTWADGKKAYGVAKVWIVYAEIDTTDLLDLIDTAINAKLESIWGAYLKRLSIPRTGPKAPVYSLGDRLDIMFKFDDSMNRTYAVIRGWEPKNRPAAPFLQESSFSDSGQIIYSVRKIAVILGRGKVCEI